MTEPVARRHKPCLVLCAAAPIDRFDGSHIRLQSTENLNFKLDRDICHNFRHTDASEFVLCTVQNSTGKAAG